MKDKRVSYIINEEIQQHMYQFLNSYIRDRNEPTFLGLSLVRFIFEKDSSIQEIMLQIAWIFILQLLILVYLLTLRLVTCLEAFQGLILVSSLAFFRLNLIGIRNEPKLWGLSSVRFRPLIHNRLIPVYLLLTFYWMK